MHRSTSVGALPTVTPSSPASARLTGALVAGVVAFIGVLAFYFSHAISGHSTTNAVTSAWAAT